jgi:hypothetical protein
MKNIALTLTIAAALAHSSHALAQASCSSDGAARPAVILERLLSADCADCWSAPASPAANDGARTVVLDWIVPGTAGDDAPLSAAATRDALLRLADLGRAPVQGTDVHVAAVTSPPMGSVRVASGPPFNDYLGASIAWQPPSGGAQARGPWHYHLLLVEAIAPGTEGTAGARNLVRNMLQGTWEHARLPSKHKQSPWVEMRTMRIPEGAKPERLFMVGWVQNAQGQALAAARSVCR